MSEDALNIVQTQPAEAEQTPKFTFKESIFAIIFSFSGYIFFKTIFFGVSIGIASALWLLGVCAAYMIFAVKSGAKQSKYSTAYFVTAVIFAINTAVSSNQQIEYLNMIFSSGMLAMWAFAVNNPMYKGADDSFVYCIFSAVFKQPFSNMGKCPSAALSLTRKSKSGQNIRNVLIGIAIALPVTLIVAGLLSSADDGFSKIMEKIFDGIFDNFIADILQFIFSLPLSFLIFGAVYAAVKNQSPSRIDLEYCRRSTLAFKIAPQTVMYTSVIPLCIIYVIFFFSQISYFTSAFMNKLPEGFSESEYARQGFFELCAVSVINLAVIVVLNLCCKYKETENGLKRPALLKFFTALISAFTIILIATAFSKMALYISRYGLTPLRVHTSWFMALLAVMFVLIIVRQFKEFNLAGIGAAAFTVMFAALSFSQTDSLIAKYNLYAYESGIIEEFDSYALNELSDDAVYTVIGMLDSDDDAISEAAEEFIKSHYQRSMGHAWYHKSLPDYIIKGIAEERNYS